MSASPSRNNLLDVLPGFSDDEECTGIHVRPTISMPPFPQRPAVISRAVLALVEEAEAEAKLEDLTAFAQDEDDVETEVVTLVQVAAPAKEPEKPVVIAPPRAEKKTSKSRRTLLGNALSLVSIGFAVGFFLTRPPTPTVSEASPEPAAAPTVSLVATSAAETAPAAAPAPVPSAPMAAPVAAPKAAAARAPSLADADRALAKGDLANAESLYQSFLARGGADHEALTGLGKVAASRHQTSDAMAFFERALARNPNYLPARLGLADLLWSAGREDAAKAQYNEIRARYSPGIFPVRVLERTR